MKCIQCFALSAALVTLTACGADANRSLKQYFLGLEASRGDENSVVINDMHSIPMARVRIARDHCAQYRKKAVYKGVLEDGFDHLFLCE